MDYILERLLVHRLWFSPVKEKLEQMNDKLELVVNERNSALESSMSQTGVGGNLAVADSHLITSATPLRKIMTCEFVALTCVFLCWISGESRGWMG